MLLIKIWKLERRTHDLKGMFSFLMYQVHPKILFKSKLFNSNIDFFRDSISGNLSSKYFSDSVIYINANLFIYSTFVLFLF